MRCIDVEKLIPDYSVTNLSRLTERRVRLHLASCESCSKQLEALRKVMLIVEEALWPLEPPAGLWNGVRSRLVSQDRETIVERPRHRPRRAFSYAVALSAGAAALVVGTISPHEPPVAERALEPAAMGYIRSHLVSASYDPLADRVSLGFAGTLHRTEEGQNL